MPVFIFNNRLLTFYATPDDKSSRSLSDGNKRHKSLKEKKQGIAKEAVQNELSKTNVGLCDVV